MATRTKWTKTTDKKAAFIFGLTFLALVLILAVFIKEPGRFQEFVFVTVLALAAAGIGAVLPGVINVDVTGKSALYEFGIRAAGAIGLFLLVYLAYFIIPRPDTLGDGLEYPLSVKDPGASQNGTILIEGKDVSKHMVGDSLVVYDSFSGTEVAIALLKVIALNPDTLSAQAILLNPDRHVAADLRADANLDQDLPDLVPPFGDWKVVGVLLEEGRVRLLQDNHAGGVKEQTVLEALDPVKQGEKIIDLMPFKPATSMQVTGVGASGKVASAALLQGDWPSPGTLVRIEPGSPGTSTPTPQLEYPLSVKDPGASQNGTILIEGKDVSKHKVGDSLVVYDSFSGTEVAIALLKVIALNPDTLSAQAILLNPDRRVAADLRADANLDQDLPDLVPPFGDWKVVGVLLEKGRVRLLQDNHAGGVKEQTVLEALDPVKQGEKIIDLMPFKPAVTMQVVDLGMAGQVAAVDLLQGMWPLPGTLVRIGVIRGSTLISITGGIALIGTDDPGAEPYETPERSVTLLPFSIEKYEVSVGQYKSCVDAEVCDPPQKPKTLEGSGPTLDLPITWVSARDAATYCNWLGRRLPSTVEWERAARGKDGRPWPWGKEPITCEEGNLVAGLCNQGPVAVNASVGEQTATEGEPTGIYHLVGNVAEWVVVVADKCDGATCRAGSSWDDSQIAFRGGAWDIPFERITHYVRSSPDNPGESIGFRCAAGL